MANLFLKNLDPCYLAKLGIVGKNYPCSTNHFLDAIVGGGGILYEIAGVLRKGKRICFGRCGNPTP